MGLEPTTMMLSPYRRRRAPLVTPVTLPGSEDRWLPSHARNLLLFRTCLSQSVAIWICAVVAIRGTVPPRRHARNQARCLLGPIMTLCSVSCHR